MLTVHCVFEKNNKWIDAGGFAEGEERRLLLFGLWYCAFLESGRERSNQIENMVEKDSYGGKGGKLWKRRREIVRDLFKCLLVVTVELEVSFLCVISILVVKVELELSNLTHL